MKKSLGIVVCLACLSAWAGADLAEWEQQRVGMIRSNVFLTPTHQLLTPAGTQVELPNMRPQAIALSPDGRLLAVSGKLPELLMLDPATGAIRQRVVLPGNSNEPSPHAVSGNLLSPDTEGQVSYTGLIFSPDGKRIFLSSVNGTIKTFMVDQGGQVKPHASFLLPPATAPWRKIEIPAGLAMSPDGKLLYVVLNLSNQIAEMDALTGGDPSDVGRWSCAL